MNNIQLLTILFIFFIGFGCNSSEKRSELSSISSNNVSAGMELLSADQTGLDFKNMVIETWKDNPIDFDGMYQGGGVAIGDINNDGLSDVYFTGNMVADRLYLNKGDFKFEDITEKAGIDNDDFWTQGVSMVDINHDGFLDIYICRGGYDDTKDERANILYINQGDNTFVDEAEKRGIADYGYSVMSNFFDADADGDLDAYIINRPNTWKNKFKAQIDNTRSPIYKFSDHLYMNDGNGMFSEESKKRGIESYFNFGLTVVTADINNDDLIDIYVANDYSGSDQCFINQGGGYFKESIKEITNHIAFFAMGTDIADLNNDGLEEIFTVEMLPSDYWRGKVTMAPMMTEEKFDIYFNRMGLQVQYMHNNLQWNRGNGKFSEIAQLCGIQKTDWSWACILEDFDNDGLRDIFISNGFKRDMFDNDKSKELYSNYKKVISDPEKRKNLDIIDFLNIIPSNPLSNYMYKNNGNWSFDNVAKEWGMADKSLSNGSACGDLDNDGDLDLIINNMDGFPMVYKNNAEGHNYIRIKLKGHANNAYGLGAKVTVRTENGEWYEQFKVVRGYLSSMEPIMHIGLGNEDHIKEIEVVWSHLKTTIVQNIDVNQTIEITTEGAKPRITPVPEKGIMAEVNKAFFPEAGHEENKHKDFKNQVLLPHRLSREGPSLAVGDINGDGIDDFYMGGAIGFPGQIYIGQNDGPFLRRNNRSFEIDKYHEDVDAAFFDPDGDGDLDLYVVSGGSEFEAKSKGYEDRLYFNDGLGTFTRGNVLPEMSMSGGCVEIGDFNFDGKPDVFVGGRLIPENYPLPTSGEILLNTGKGFALGTAELAPELENIGMITDATWTDINGDGKKDLVVVGEWMAVTIMIYENGKYVNKTADYGLDEMTGWWFTVESRDLDQDGDNDLIVGNLGKNYKHKASKEKPFHAYGNDFDENGTYDVVLAKYDGDREVPVRGRECTSQQLPGIREKFPTYRAFAEADINQIIPGRKDPKTIHLKVNTFASYILENTSEGFKKHKMPFEAQVSTIRSIAFSDIDKDGKEDIILAGNMFSSEPETTRADASMGLVLSNKGKLDYEVMKPSESGLYIPYDVRNISIVKNGKGEERLLIGSNNDLMRLYSL